MGFLDSDSDSSDDSSSFGLAARKKAAAAKVAAPAPPPNKSSFLDSSSSDDDSSPLVKRKPAAPPPVPAAKKSVPDSDDSDDSSDDSDSSIPKKTAPATPPAPVPPPAPEDDSSDESSDDSDSSPPKKAAPPPVPKPPPPPAPKSDSSSSDESSGDNSSPNKASAASSKSKRSNASSKKSNQSQKSTTSSHRSSPNSVTAHPGVTEEENEEAASQEEKDNPTKDDQTQEEKSDSGSKQSSKQGEQSSSKASSNSPQQEQKEEISEEIIPDAESPKNGKAQGFVYEVVEEEIIEEDAKSSSPSSSPSSSVPPPPPPTGRIYRESSTGDWSDTVTRVKRLHGREQRGALQVVYCEPHVTDMLEYNQFLDSALSVNDATHIAEDYKETPWYEEDYEELPWHQQPDLDADDELTALCKKVLLAGEDRQENEQLLQARAERVEAKVIGFALKLKNRWLERKKSRSNSSQDSSRDGKVPLRTPTSLISGPESVGSNGSNSHSSNGQQQSRQRTFQAQSGHSDMQNIDRLSSSLTNFGSTVTPCGQLPTSMMDANSSHRRHWSVIDSGRRSNHLTSSPQSQIKQLRQKRHSIAIAPSKGKPLSNLVSSLDISSTSQQSRRRLSMIDSGYKKDSGRRSSLMNFKSLLHPQQQTNSTPQQQRVPTLQPIGEQEQSPDSSVPPLFPMGQQQQPGDGQADSHTNRYLTPPGAQANDVHDRRQQQHPQRHSIATTPTKERPLVSSSNVVSQAQLRQPPPPLHQDHHGQPPLSSAGDITDSPLSSINSATSRRSHPSYAGDDRPRSRTGDKGMFDADDDLSQLSVPFDEPSGRDFFQDEYYYESKKQLGRKGKRTKPRRQSQDPPAAAPGMSPTRKQPLGVKGRERMLSSVEVTHLDMDRNLSGLSNVSSYAHFNFGASPNSKVSIDPIETANSFPPSVLESKIERAQAAQDNWAQNPTPVPEIFQNEIDELERQWKIYSSRVSPATATSDETYLTEDNFSPASKSTRFAPNTKFGLAEEERNHLVAVTGTKSKDDESDTDPVTHALNHLHDNEEIAEKETCMDWAWDYTGAFGVGFMCLAVWVIVLVVSFTDLGSPYFSNVQNGGSPTTSQSIVPTVSPNGPGVGDPLSLLPPYSYDAIQEDLDSPQSLAWLWLNEQDIEGISEEKLLQRFSLATLYYAAVGEESNLDNGSNSSAGSGAWLDPETDECLWHVGLQCNADDILTQVILPEQNLQGTIPQEIGIWTNLHNMDLGRNPQLQGTIPSTIGLLSDLLGLDLHGDDLTGAVPSELGLLTDLEWLTLATQNGDSTVVSSSRNTDSRKLSSVLPTELGQLVKLEHMRLENNRIEGPIPSELGNLRNLRTLVLRQNAFNGTIPSRLGALVQLQGLAVDFNQIIGRIPNEIADLTNLVELHLSENALTGPLPEGLSALSDSLTWISLSGNSLTGMLPLSWSELSKLQVLQMEDNPGLTGTIPVDWGIKWAELQRIWLHETSLTGEVPVTLCFLKDDPEYPLETIGVSCDRLVCDCGCWCV